MPTTQPLADRLRPTTLDDVVGHSDLTTPGSIVYQLAQGTTSAKSLIISGPPGTGKTTIARIIMAHTPATTHTLSAIDGSGVKAIRDIIARAEKSDTHTIVFIDEIHRFSKAQQDALLGAVENGTISLIGATTENPSFSINSALLSRSMVITVDAVSDADIAQAITRIPDKDTIFSDMTISNDVADTIARYAAGDLRHGYTIAEAACEHARHHKRTDVTVEDVRAVHAGVVANYDRDGDAHYDITSAWLKSMRGSDPDATLYWLARMIDGGEDPRFIARRLIVHAAEDVGLADPHVLTTCVSAAHAVALIGMPEARIPLAEAALAVATAPKSNAAKAGIDAALTAVRGGAMGPVPVHLRDSHYPGAKARGHGDGYKFPHAYPYGIVDQNYMPENLNPDDLHSTHQPPTVLRKISPIDSVVSLSTYHITRKIYP